MWYKCISAQMYRNVLFVYTLVFYKKCSLQSFIFEIIGADNMTHDVKSIKLSKDGVTAVVKIILFETCM